MENGEIGTDNSTTIKDMEMETNRIEETKYPNKQQKIPGHKKSPGTQQPVNGRDSRPHNNRGLQNRPFHQEQRRPYNQQGYQRDHYPQGPQNRPPYYEQWRPYNHQGYQRDYHSQGPRPQYNYPPNYRNTWNRPIQQGPYQHYDEYRNGPVYQYKGPNYGPPQYQEPYYRGPQSIQHPREPPRNPQIPQQDYQQRYQQNSTDTQDNMYQTPKPQRPRFKGPAQDQYQISTQNRSLPLVENEQDVNSPGLFFRKRVGHSHHTIHNKRREQ